MALPPKTFDALLLLVRNAGRLLQKRTMLEALWPDAFVEEANLTNAISQLRKALGDAALIATVSKQGYRFTAQVRTVDRQATPAQRSTAQHAAAGPEAIQPYLDKICSSPGFERSHRLQRFLKYTVEWSLANPGAPLKEYAIALAVYDKPPAFDPQADPIIRVEASRLRSRLLEYYAGPGLDDPVVIDFPKGGYSPVVRARTSGHASPAAGSIAVIPLSDSPDPELRYLVDAISEGLTRRLGKIASLRVAPWNMVVRSKEPLKDLAQTARYLNVQTLLMVKLLERAGACDVHAEWIDPERKAHLWGVQYRRRLTEIHGLEDEITLELAPRIAPHLTASQVAEIARRQTIDGRAYQLYLKGRHLWNKRTADALTKAIQYYRGALDLDPGYALAFAGMADCYVTLATFAFVPPADGFPRAKAAAARALELDPSLGEARTVLACIRAVYDWEWTQASREFQDAVSAAPRYPVAAQFYGACLCAMGEFAAGRQLLRTALDLDPLSPMIGTQLGVGYYVERQFEEAIRQFTSVLDLDPHFWAAFHFLGLCYAAAGRPEDAISKLRRAVELSGGVPFALAGLGCVLARSGRQDEAGRLLSQLQSRSAVEYVPPYSLALICCGLERRQEALGYLEQARAERSPSILMWLGVEPLLDPLRTEPGFQRLLQSAGLTPATNS